MCHPVIIARRTSSCPARSSPTSLSTSSPTSLSNSRGSRPSSRASHRRPASSPSVGRASSPARDRNHRYTYRARNARYSIVPPWNTSMYSSLLHYARGLDRSKGVSHRESAFPRPGGHLTADCDRKLITSEVNARFPDRDWLKQNTYHAVSIRVAMIGAPDSRRPRHESRVAGAGRRATRPRDAPRRWLRGHGSHRHRHRHRRPRPTGRTGPPGVEPKRLGLEPDPLTTAFDSRRGQRVALGIEPGRDREDESIGCHCQVSQSAAHPLITRFGGQRTRRQTRS